MQKKVFFYFFIFLFYLFSLNVCLAQGLVPNDRGQKATGDYEINDIIRMLPTLSDWLLGMVGSVALLMFVYGGVTFLISSGNSDKVAEGKSILINSVIGLVIVFTSYLIISFVFVSLGVTTPENSRIWATTGWF